MGTVSIADQLRVLIELQKLDSQLYRLRQEMKAKPAEADRLKAEHARAAQALQGVESRYRALELRRKERENDLDQKEQQIKKLQVQLFQVKTNKEYTAMQKGIEGHKADQSVLEEETLKLMEEVDKVKAEMAAERDSHKAREAELAAQLKRISEESERIQGSIEELQAARAELAPKMESPLLGQYERILRRREGLALVPVVGSACGGCYMVLPPQVINEVQMSSRLVPCESCGRILYIEATG